MKKKLGLIVNPIAGIGGRVGLKGSDSPEIQQKALELGAEPQAQNRAQQALERLKARLDPEVDLQTLTYPGEMGEQAARATGLEPTVIGAIEPGATTAQDTREAAQEMLEREVDLLLFAGGDGTARDVYSAVGDRLPVLGIPAGVKIHSAAFATSPRSAGDLAASFLQGDTTELREAEVLDLDEEAVREGVVSAELYGYVRIPFQNRLIQGLKAPSSPEDQAAMESIAADIVDRMQEDQLYILGPGTTTRAITAALDLDKTLIGVDVVRNKELVARDVNESELLTLLDQYDEQAYIVVTPIGGQGYIFGRGNQQISYLVIEKVGTDHVIVVSTPDKMYSLDRRPLLADTGSREVDEELAGYVKVITGYKESMMYKVAYA